MESIEERLNQAEIIIKQASFRQNKGLGNEIGYYIFDYSPEDELYVRQRINYIYKLSNNENAEFSIALFDLYDIVINILKEKGYLEKCYDFEKRNGLDRVVKAIGNMLKITSTEGLIIKHIKENTPDNSVVFITGIGKAYPIIRSHLILNNLPQVLDNVPVVLFYPGKYENQELILFNEIKDGNYYRALKLVE